MRSPPPSRPGSLRIVYGTIPFGWTAEVVGDPRPCRLLSFDGTQPHKTRPARLFAANPWRRCHHSDRRSDSGAKSPGRAGAAARRFPGNYGPGAGANPDGVVAVTDGDATLVSGAVGGVVVVIVCSVPCGTPGPTTCSDSAELTSPRITPSAPMAITALTPIVADPNFHCFACTLTTPQSGRGFAGATGADPQIVRRARVVDPPLNG
jgi:hypothetical protein